MTPADPESLSVALIVLDVLDRLGIEHHLGGSYASSIHGTPRQTQDVALVVDLEAATIEPLITALADDFYADDELARLAFARKGSFNVVHLSSGVKIDLFFRGKEPFDHSEFGRAQWLPVEGLSNSGRLVRVKTPEDIILRKLQWYRLGGESSDRQWADVLGCLEAQGAHLDRDYLEHWAREIEVIDLLQRAQAESTT